MTPPRKRMTSHSLRVLTGVSLAAFIAQGASAAETCSGSICIANLWTRATPHGAQNAALYFSIANKGNEADTLLGATTPAAAHVMIHQTTHSGGMAKMRMAHTLSIPAKGGLAFAPGGYHVMLTGLKTPLREGATAPLTLNFTKAGKISLVVPVLNIAATGRQGVATPSGAAPMGAMHH